MCDSPTGGSGPAPATPQQRDSTGLPVSRQGETLGLQITLGCVGPDQMGPGHSLSAVKAKAEHAFSCQGAPGALLQGTRAGSGSAVMVPPQAVPLQAPPKKQITLTKLCLPGH